MRQVDFQVTVKRENAWFRLELIIQVC